MPRFTFTLFFICTFNMLALSQSGIIKGRVTDTKTNEALSFVDVYIVNLKDTMDFSVMYTNEGGYYEFDNLIPGYYRIEANLLSYNGFNETEIRVVNNKPTVVDINLRPSSKELTEVVIKSRAFTRSKESPVSKRTLGITEIRRNPGAAQDISKVFKILPGVTAPPVTFRNDLFIRGGGPNENSFYLDGIQVPVINHFTTQGSSGGPAGMINTEFIDRVDFLSSSFPAKYGNALSSVIDFSFREGRSDRLGATFNLGSTNAGLTLEGPLGSKTTYLMSVRRSYLQLLFSVIDLAFLPSYWDFQAKVKHKINENHHISFIGLGAIDDLQLNNDAYNSESNAATLERLPELNQWNYTNGLIYEYFRENGIWKAIISRTMLDNSSIKYRNNIEKDENLIFDYNSREIYNNARIERIFYAGDSKITIGGRYQFVKYSNNSILNIFKPSGNITLKPQSSLNFHDYSIYGQYGNSFFEDKLDLSFGIQLGGNTYSEQFSNPFKQLSPRLSMSYKIWKDVSINGSLGRYYQRPPLTILGYEENGVFVNKENKISPIIADHYVLGISYTTPWQSQLSLEAYYKDYSEYPILLRDSVNLANLGGDFSVVGNEPAISGGEGRAYGLELLFQQKLFKNLYGSVSYTLGFSEFSDKTGELIPSSWDTRHILNISGGIRLPKNWDISASYRYQSPQPNTPYSQNSNLVQSWIINNGGIRDYDKLNTLRKGDNNLINLRIDKKWFFEKWNLNIYLDIENLLGDAIEEETLILDRPVDAEGIPYGDPTVINPQDPLELQRYKLKTIESNSGIIVPTLGIMLEI